MDSKKTKAFFGIPLPTLSLIILLALLAVGLLAIAIRGIYNQSSPAIINSINPSQADTVLTLSDKPIVVSTPSGSFYNLDVYINTGVNKLSSVELTLSYDPNVLANVDINPGPLLASPVMLLKNIDTQDGIISYALSPNAEQNTISGKGAIATISFTLSPNQNVATSTSIMFLPKTEVTAQQSAQSLLKSAQGNTFTIFPFATPTQIPVFEPVSSSSATMSANSGL